MSIPRKGVKLHIGWWMDIPFIRKYASLRWNCIPGYITEKEVTAFVLSSLFSFDGLVYGSRNRIELSVQKTAGSGGSSARLEQILKYRLINAKSTALHRGSSTIRGSGDDVDSQETSVFEK